MDQYSSRRPYRTHTPNIRPRYGSKRRPISSSHSEPSYDSSVDSSSSGNDDSNDDSDDDSSDRVSLDYPKYLEYLKSRGLLNFVDIKSRSNPNQDSQIDIADGSKLNYGCDDASKPELTVIHDMEYGTDLSGKSSVIIGCLNTQNNTGASSSSTPKTRWLQVQPYMNGDIRTNFKSQSHPETML